MSYVFRDVGGIYPTAIFQSGTLLADVERNLTRSFISGSRHGIMIQQTLYHFIFYDRLSHNFFGVCRFYMTIHYPGWFDGNQGTDLAESLTSAANHIYIVMFMFFGIMRFQGDGYFQST